MANNGLNTEDKIFNAAYNVFLLFGYHGTTLSQIASRAGVNKAAIHYYFRSKEKLYVIVVKSVLDLILSATFDFYTKQERFEKQTWFLYTELYNNRHSFEHALKEIYPDDWECKMNESGKWLVIAIDHLFLSRNQPIRNIL